MAKINFIERDLETIIENTSPSILCERGLPIRENSVFMRQVRLGEYGIADLVCVSAQRSEDTTFKHLNVFELKQNEINVASLLQLSRYLKAVSKFKDDPQPWTFDIVGTLIGRSVDLKSDFVYLAAQCPFVEMYTYDVDIDGMWFKKFVPHEYGLVNPGKAEAFTNNLKYHMDKLCGVEPSTELISDLPY